MDRLLDERAREEHDLRRDPGAVTVPAPARAVASTLGNHAVARLARRSVAREALEEQHEGAAPADGVAPEAVAPDEAEGLTKLDELPEDELPE